MRGVRLGGAMFAVLALAVPWRCSAADRWAILTVDGQWMADGVEVAADGSRLVCSDAARATTNVPMDSVVVMMQRAPAAPGTRDTAPAVKRFYAELVSGERVLADSISLVGALLKVRSDRWGTAEFGLGTVRRIVASDAALPPAGADFTGVRYANGDAVEGRIAALSDSSAVVEMPEIGKVPVESLAGVADIVLVKGGDAAMAPTDMDLLLRTGERFFGRLLGGAGYALRVKPEWTPEPLAVPLEMVAAVGFFKGRTVLSDLTPKSVTEKPFIDFQRPWQRNRALTGKPLSAGWFPAARGLALHTKTVLEYALPASHGELLLVGWVGIDDAIPAGPTSAELRFACDGATAGPWRLAPGGGLMPVRFEIPAEAATLSVTAEYGEYGSVGDHVDVLYPCLIPRGSAP